MNKSTLVLFLFIFLASIVHSQQIGNSAWLALKVKKDISKKLSFKAGLGYRESNINDKSRFVDLSLKYKINKSIKIAGGYRLGIDKENINYFENTNRFNLDLNIKHSFSKKLKLIYRLRYQKKYSEIFTSELGYLPNNNFRNRITLSYKLNKKTLIKGSIESFAKQNYKTPIFFNKIRNTIGLERKINKKQSLGACYIYQQETQVANPLLQSILSLEYRIEL